MALAYLGMFYIAIMIVTVIFQFLLYKAKTKSRNQGLYFFLNLLLCFFLSYITYTSLPSNFALQRILALLWSGMAVLGFIVKINMKDSEIISKTIVTVAIIGNLLQMFI